MTTKTRALVAAVLLLAVAGAYALWWDRGSAEPGPVPSSVAASPATLGADSPRGSIDPVAAVAAPEREAIAPPSESAPTTGDLLVRVRYGDQDHAPAVGLTVVTRRLSDDFRVGAKRARTDDAGSARVTGLPPGRMYVETDRGMDGKRVEIVVGQTTELDFELAVGLTITGIVVDPQGVPVQGALVEMAPMAHAGRDAAVVAVTDAAGRFSVRACPTACLVGARAAGHCASRLRFLFAKGGNTVEVRLELGPAGGAVEGIVARADGTPITDAVVRIGTGPISGLRIALAPGAVCRGVVRNAADAPVSGADVEVGQWEDFAHFRTRTAADGGFELTGLPTGEVTIAARQEEHGKASVRLRTETGVATSSVRACAPHEPDHPETISETRELAADASWDLGQIRLADGGRAQIRIVAGDAATARFSVADPGLERFSSVTGEGAVRQTGVLAVGDHLLLISGEGIAAQVVPFAIRAGSENEVQIRLTPGVRQRVEIAAPAEVGAFARVRVRRGASVVLSTSARRQGDYLVAEVWLAAGEYTVHVTAGTLAAEGAITVGETEAPPRRFALR